VLSGSATDAYASGSVSTTTSGQAGGFVGELASGGSVTRAYSAGSVSAALAPEGGFIGESNGGTLDACHFNATANLGLDPVGNDPSAMGVSLQTDTALTQQASFVGWDFASIWQIDEDISPPTLRIASDTCSSCPLAVDTISPNTGYYPGGLEVT